MNDYLLAILLGIIEGLTEFLPISSTAHLRLTQAAVGQDGILESGYWKMFTVFIQLGAILAVVFYFRHRLWTFLRTFPRGEAGDQRWWNHPLTLVGIAFVVTAIPLLLLSEDIKDNLESLWVIGWALVIGAVVMWIVDVVFQRPSVQRVERLTVPQAVIVGTAQIFSAIFPGTSRSMATIAGGQLAGLSRPAALEFSFFLSIPTMFAACLFDLRESISAPMGAAAHIEGGMTPERWAQLAIGFVISFLVAWGVIAWFMHWVRKHGFIPFAIYRLVIGAIVLVWASRMGSGG